jgi:hypothetical protein
MSPLLHSSVSLLDQITQVLTHPNQNIDSWNIGFFQLTNRSMRSCITINSDLLIPRKHLQAIAVCYCAVIGNTMCFAVCPAAIKMNGV